jgi:hypothetical protein
MEATQAAAPGQPQAQTPVHPIHEEQAIVESLTNWVGQNPDNDPHTGTDLESPPSGQDTPQGAAADDQEVEINEDTPIFDIEYKTEAGKEVKKLSLKELREGYLAKSDYHRNIQKVKAQESQVEQMVQQKAMEAAQAYAQQLELQKQLVLKTVAPELAGIDLNKLAAEDPAEAQRIFFKQIQLNQTLQNIQAEQQKVYQEFQAKQKEALQKKIQESRSTLESEVRGWNEETYQTVLKSMVNEYGLDQNAVANVVDAGLIKVFHDAHQYRQLQKAKPEVEKKVVAVPKVVKPGSADKPNPASEVVQTLETKLRKTGDWRDAAALYLARQKQQKKGS